MTTTTTTTTNDNNIIINRFLSLNLASTKTVILIPVDQGRIQMYFYKAHGKYASVLTSGPWLENPILNQIIDNKSCLSFKILRSFHSEKGSLMTVRHLSRFFPK